MRREYRQSLVGCCGTMVDDIYALNVLLELVEIVAVELIEFDVLGNVVEVTADHIVVADHLVPVREEGVGEVAAEKSRHSRDEDTLFFHRNRPGFSVKQLF